MIVNCTFAHIKRAIRSKTNKGIPNPSWSWACYMWWRHWTGHPCLCSRRLWDCPQWAQCIEQQWWGGQCCHLSDPEQPGLTCLQETMSGLLQQARACSSWFKSSVLFRKVTKSFEDTAAPTRRTRITSLSSLAAHELVSHLHYSF